MFACLRPVRGVFRLILAVEVLSIAYRNPVWTSFALSGVRGGIVHGTHSTLQGLTARALHASVHNPTPAESGFTSRRELASLLAAAGVFVGAHSDAANAGFFDIKPKKFYDPKGRYALEYPGDWKVSKLKGGESYEARFRDTVQPLEFLVQRAYPVPASCLGGGQQCASIEAVGDLEAVESILNSALARGRALQSSVSQLGNHTAYMYEFARGLGLEKTAVMLSQQELLEFTVSTSLTRASEVKEKEEALLASIQLL